MTATIEKATRGSLVEGVLLSLACQVATFVTLDVVDRFIHLGFFGLLWSIPQWCFVIPLLLNLKHRQRERTTQGLFIASWAGVALNAGFLWLAYDSINNLIY
ncbi:MAG TPA: hypothetical protein VGG72_15160 [Bryobacteraceae bacterium]|jgi:hypothetical protein